MRKDWIGRLAGGGRGPVDLTRVLSLGRHMPVMKPPVRHWSVFRVRRLVWTSNLCWFVGLLVSSWLILILWNVIAGWERKFQVAVAQYEQRFRSAEERTVALQGEIGRLQHLNLYTSAQAIEIARHMHTVMESGRGGQMDFLEAIVPEALRAQITRGVPASATVAMAIYESNYGRSELSVKSHNYFGIKAFEGSWTGPKVEARTRDSGQLRTAHFRCYSSLHKAVAGYGDFLSEGDRYKPAFAHRGGEKFVQAILKAGYCPDGDYLANIRTIMERHHLALLDLPEGQTVVVGRN